MEAAELLGISERTFRRWRDRHREFGASGLDDRRLAPPLRRAPVAEIERMLGLYRDLYRGFTMQHFARNEVVGEQADHRDTTQWRFHVVPARDLPATKTIGMTAIRVALVSFEQLEQEVQRVSEVVRPIGPQPVGISP